MQCGSCGTELLPGAAYCPSCGTVTPYHVSASEVSPYDHTVASSSSGLSQSKPATDYGSPPYGMPSNPYEINPYSVTDPSSGESSQHPSSLPPAPPPRRHVTSGLIIGILVLGLILVSGFGVFALFLQRAELLNQIQRATPTAQTVPLSTPTATASPQAVPANGNSFDTSYYYRLTNNFLGTGQALTVRTDGSHRLTMAPTGNDPSQLWKFVALSAGKYALRSASLGDGFSLDVINDGINNTPIMNPTGNYSGQYWSVVPWGDGTYMLTNDFTGPQIVLDTYSDTHQPFLEAGDHTGQHWTLTQVHKIQA